MCFHMVQSKIKQNLQYNPGDHESSSLPKHIPSRKTAPQNQKSTPKTLHPNPDLIDRNGRKPDSNPIGEYRNIKGAIAPGPIWECNRDRIKQYVDEHRSGM
ncbi:hypothetical protein ZHAS_00022077 [Anopheles sinensis]|uniref:Uncharacterized protein n=1 Tax=Anopheles sinensis TaxID=74873 RepID=A0A084WTY3_ANOSI|nr:hypothetical protein ZHAS_00022077 [Anopheles sinensis]